LMDGGVLRRRRSRREHAVDLQQCLLKTCPDLKLSLKVELSEYRRRSICDWSSRWLMVRPDKYSDDAAAMKCDENVEEGLDICSSALPKYFVLVCACVTKSRNSFRCCRVCLSCLGLAGLDWTERCGYGCFRSPI